jgi:hypothetical protein
MHALTPLQPIAAHGRGALSPARLEEHVKATVKRLKKLGLRQGDRVASLLPPGPDAMTAMLALESFPSAKLFTLDTSLPPERYMSLLLEINPRLLLMHRGEHPAAEAARSLAIPVANVLRHYEAGVFTLEQSVTPMREQEPLIPAWKSRGAPLVLMAPGLAYRSLAKRLDSMNPVIGITPPSLEILPPPHTIEHVAAECVRMLRRYRAHGPYALAGWRSEGLIALEMARLLEQEGESVAFVALLNASDLFARPIGRFLLPIRRLLGGKSKPVCEAMAEALRQYRPRPWHGRILHIRPAHERESGMALAWFDWGDIAPNGISTFEAPAEMLTEPHVETLAGILALELGHMPNCDNRGSEPHTRHA